MEYFKFKIIKNKNRNKILFLPIKIEILYLIFNNFNN